MRVKITVRLFQFHTQYFKILWPYRYWYNIPRLCLLNVTIEIRNISAEVIKIIQLSREGLNKVLVESLLTYAPSFSSIS